MPLYTPRLPLIGSGQTVTTSQPLLDLTQTWNDAGVTFTGLKANFTSTASAAASLLLDLQVGGVSMFSVVKTGFILGYVQSATGFYQESTGVSAFLGGLAGLTIAGENSYIGWAATNANNGADLKLFRDGAANVLALRNATAAQTLRVYNTWTDASNYQRFNTRFVSNDAYLEVIGAGTGAANGGLVLAPQGGIYLAAGTTTKWSIETTGHILAFADNTYDIGAGGANRPRNLFVANTVLAGQTGALRWPGRTILRSPADGVMTLLNDAEDGFSRLQFGLTTSAAPSIKRNAAALNFRLADDSADAAITTAAIGASGSLTFSVAAAGVILKQGANGRVGTFVLNGTTPVAVSNTSVAITDSIIISLNTIGGVVGVFPSIVTITAATGFSVAGTAADTSTYNYSIIKNAA